MDNYMAHVSVVNWLRDLGCGFVFVTEQDGTYFLKDESDDSVQEFRTENELITELVKMEQDLRQYRKEMAE